MASCIVCGVDSDKEILFNCIYEGKISRICRDCLKTSDAIVINRPSDEQLMELDRKRSVREVMDSLTNNRKRIARSKDNSLTNKDLARLKFPAERQDSQDLVKNYDWLLKQARRRKKLSTLQVSEQLNIDKSQIEQLEAGQLFQGFEKIALILQDFYDIKILLNTDSIKLLSNREERKKREIEILSSVGEKMRKHKFLLENRNKNLDIDEEVETEYGEIDINSIIEEKELKKSHNREMTLDEKLKSGKIDFSKKEDLDKITIQDLVDRKKNK